MRSKKIRNISYSLIALASWISIVLFMSTSPDKNSGVVSVFQVWILLTTVIADIGAVILIIIRIFKVIDKNTNFLYCFLGVTNSILGLGGILFYSIQKINITGLHDLLFNLFLGAIILSDLFFFEPIIEKEK
jgi:hypothetical protein